MIESAPDVILMMSGGLQSIGGVDGLEKIPASARHRGPQRTCRRHGRHHAAHFGSNTARLAALAEAIYHPDAG